MSLATRCPACSTVFRVVQDQLRVSEGWVRCGQCQEVFNALETLFDLGAAGLPEAPAEPPTQHPSPAPAFEATQPASDDTPAHAEAEDQAVEEALGEWAEGPRPEDDWNPGQATLPMSLEALAASYRAGQPPIDATEPAAAPVSAAPAFAATSSPPTAAAVPDQPGVDIRGPLGAPIDEVSDEEDAPTPSRFIGPVPDWARSPASDRRSKKRSRRPAAATDAAHAQPHVADKAQRRRRTPEFVRQAERAALWRRPWVRALLGGAASLLVALLLAQAAYHYREPLAARSPVLAPALHAGCEWLGCRIGAPRALERIRLDASDLSRTPQDQVLRFTADLHNTADHAVRTPALDLSFTDAQGQVVSRKVLLPAELGARGEAMAAGGQWRVDARLAVGDLRIAGYTVEVFYP
jgi:predicted Zn finger-like uncharacterized protein